jgi:hypothetical protein
MKRGSHVPIANSLPRAIDHVDKSVRAPIKKEAARSIIPGKNPKPSGKLNRAAYIVSRRAKISSGPDYRQPVFRDFFDLGELSGLPGLPSSIDAREIGKIARQSGFFS